ncbi:MAG: glycosyltransferase family 4 protein [Halolamina sp.]
MRVAFASLTTSHHDRDAAGDGDGTGAGLDGDALARLRRTAELLADHGHDVHYLCGQWWDGDAVPQFDDDGVTYRRVTRDRSPREFAAKLPVAVGRIDPDVVQVPNGPSSHVVAASAGASLVRAPTIVDWWRSRREREYDRVVSAADAILTPSETVRTEARERGADGDDVTVVPDPVDTDRIREAPVSERADVVYANDLDGDANVETFLLALAELRDRDWRAAVVGDGPARAAAERTARDLRIDDRVAFLGDLPLSERLPIYRGAHVFAQTAAREAFAGDLLWALACGCLGVVEYQSGSSAHELVESRDRGRLVTSPQELADEIVAAADRDRLTVSDEFGAYDRETVAERYRTTYRSAVEAYGWF